jgi:hypothetical protein
MQLLESAAARDRVKRLIVTPLEGRGEPPRGWTREAMLADYVLALGDYPEDVLARAAAKVRDERTRSTWPLAGEFRDACEKMGGKAIAKPTAAADPRIAVSVAAWAYVDRRLAAGNDALLLRAIRGGWQRDCRQWLFEHACAQIRVGDDPRVSEAALEEQIAVWEIEAGKRNASQAALMAAAPRTTWRPVYQSNPETAARVAAAHGQQRDAVDLDEEIPPAASEDDYGAEAAA